MNQFTTGLPHRGLKYEDDMKLLNMTISRLNQIFCLKYSLSIKEITIDFKNSSLKSHSFVGNPLCRHNYNSYQWMDQRSNF